ncbi:hypothetical protein ACIQAC_35320 [Streptomyces sp. NPDC088387]|uniref:hypothetical protein n=1 Tax=Streptomyces sp. NPDC088387 TaxID=3365859 RepID=UPI0037F1BF04
MRKREGGPLRALGRSVGEGLMWMGFAWYGTQSPHPWTEWAGCALPPTGQPPCLPPVPHEVLAELDALQALHELEERQELEEPGRWTVPAEQV